jgi:hypothetical protein
MHTPPPGPPPVFKKGTANKFSHDEMFRKAKWNSAKKEGDGMSHCFSQQPIARLGVFVLEKV